MRNIRNEWLGRLVGCAILATVPLMLPTFSDAQAPPGPPPPAPIMPPALPPAHVVDLMTATGAAALSAQWKTMEAKIIEVPPIPTALPGYTKGYDIDPHAGAANYDDSKWPTIEPKDLAARRGGGRVSFIWYRTTLTIPAKIGEFDTTGAVAVLHVLVDDYAEIWVNGQIPRRLGRPSPATIQGFNMPNRVVLTETVNAGDSFQIAVFGINGPISLAPPNTVWFREAKMEFIR
jgi:gluconolactonase